MIKNCNHIFHSVYYGSEWEVECKKCNENIYKAYPQKEANQFINNLLNTRILQKNSLFYPQYKKEYTNIFFKKKLKWVGFKRWYAGSDYPPYSSDYESEAEFGNLTSAENFIQEELKNNIIMIHKYTLKK